VNEKGAHEEGASSLPASSRRPSRWELYERNAEAVRIKLRRSGVSEAELEDLAQMVFFAAFRREDVVPEDAMLARAWLLDTANRHAANWRRLWRHTREVQDEKAIDAALGEPEDTELRAAVVDEVRETMEGLETREREVLMRRFVEGETLQEIGAQVGVSRSTACVWVEAARGRVRQVFERLRNPTSTGAV